MSEWEHPGAKWWKFDFHTHTPASTDFKSNQAGNNHITPSEWLQKFMVAGIDCVAITDHNSGEWIDGLKDSLEKLKQQGGPLYHPLHIFPGVEISVHAGVHLLAIFDPQKTTGDINTLLGSVGYGGTKGESDVETTKTLTEVTSIIEQDGGIAIPAHVDKSKGLFESMQGASLKKALEDPCIHAIELCNERYEKPQAYQEKNHPWTEIVGSDLHDFGQDSFGTYTWVKMDEPSIEGLKLALIDGSPSINRNMSATPNQHAEYLLEEITVGSAKYLGRPNPISICFSPFLNTIIGGRGSGKSTLLEFMRLILRRDKEIPESLAEESKKYFHVGDENLLLSSSKLSMVYRKEGTRYRLQWSANAEAVSLEVYDGQGWIAEEGDIKSLFPAYIYSQKQIFSLAQNPDALLNIIDKDPSVEHTQFNQEYSRLKNRYKQLEQKIGMLREQIGEKGKLTGTLNDLIRQTKKIEGSGHKEVLQAYRQRRRQQTVMQNLEDDWKEIVAYFGNMKDEIGATSFDQRALSPHPDMLQAVNDANSRWQAVGKKLETLADEAQSIVDDWVQTKDRSRWMKELEIDIEKYEQLHTQFEQQGVDPDKYPTLLQQQALCRKELERIDDHHESLKKSEEEKCRVYKKLKQARDLLTKNRVLFLESVLEGQDSVKIEVSSFGQKWEEVEKRLRQILQCEDRFDRDFENLRDSYGNSDDRTEASQGIKDKLLEICKDNSLAGDRRFAKHLANLPKESISDLICWFPEDALKITFGDQQNIQQGSPGQRTAALLAFILSYGKEPLLLDQPEDDLDNELIFGLIVKQLRETKSRRQIIIITHNANIVVNGDAEMVFPLTVTSGRSIVEHCASIQSKAIREKICNILEGGDKAFEQRYRRIHLEPENV